MKLVESSVFFEAVGVDLSGANSIRNLVNGEVFTLAHIEHDVGVKGRCQRTVFAQRENAIYTLVYRRTLQSSERFLTLSFEWYGLDCKYMLTPEIDWRNAGEFKHAFDRVIYAVTLPVS